MRLGWSPQHSSTRIRGMAKVAAVLSVVVYMFIYLRGPFSETWNNILVAAFPAIAAALAAALATMVSLHYDREETPRRIWLYFAIGLWLWTAAELTYGYLDVTQEEVSVGLPDLFWVVAYVFFAHALVIQYRLLANPSRPELWKRIGSAALFMVVLYLALYRLLIHTVYPDSQVDALVDSFYPVAGFCLGLVALWLVRNFQGGAFARPWLGLLAFAFTDLLYAWIDTSGMYDKYDKASTGWTALFDTSYFAAYLILGLGLLAQWAFLRYGLRSETSEK